MNQSKILTIIGAIIFVILIGIIAFFLISSRAKNDLQLQEIVNCPKIFSQIKADLITLSQDGNYVYTNDSESIQKIEIKDCTFKILESKKIIKAENDRFLLCNYSDKYITYSLDQEKKPQLVDFSSGKESPLTFEESEIPIYCDSSYITTQFAYEEPTPIFGIYDILENKKLKKVENEDLFNIIAINKDSAISYIENDKPGLYLDNSRILDAYEFGNWNISNDKNKIYYIAVNNDISKIFEYDIQAKSKIFLQQFKDNFSQEFIVTKDKKIIFKDLEGFLRAYSISER